MSTRELVRGAIERDYEDEESSHYISGKSGDDDVDEPQKSLDSEEHRPLCLRRAHRSQPRAAPLPFCSTQRGGREFC